MRNFLTLVALTGVMLLGTNSFAIFPQDAPQQALLKRANNVDPLPGIGNVVNWTKNMVRATYDFSVQGSPAVNSVGLSLLDDQGNTIALPAGAIITNATFNVLTAVKSAGNSSVAVYLLTAGDILASSTFGQLAGFQWNKGFTAGVPVGTAATWLGPTTVAGPFASAPGVMVGGSSVALVVSAGSLLSQGKFELFLEYVIQ